MTAALSIYHRLPPSARSLVASARGYYLRWWRYDEQTEKLVEEALERDHWTQQQWDEWRQERLSFVLRRAAAKVPYYREMWAQRRRDGDRSSIEYLENWPILEKKALRQNPLAFVADDCDPKRMFHDHTSGTTGTSLDLWSSGETVKYWYGLSEARWRRWYGVSMKDRWAILGGQLVTPVNQNLPPFWVWNAGLSQLYMSSYHLSPANLRFYLDELKRRRVRYILGYTSALYSLAKAAREQQRIDLEFDVVITNAEPIYEHQRELIADTFGCPVRETYGMAEMVAAASECSRGSLHQWPEAGMIECPGDRGEAGKEFICTGLVNPDMPLVRYRIGDCGSLSQPVCDCGKTLPVIEQIEGRNDDLLYTRDGRRVGRLDPVFKDMIDVSEAQIVQRTLSDVIVRYVSACPANADVERSISDQLLRRMGDIKVSFERVSGIPRTARGKFRAVVCELSDAERALVE